MFLSLHEFADQQCRMYRKCVPMTSIPSGNKTVWYAWKTPDQRQAIGCKPHDARPAIGDTYLWQIERFMDECVKVLLNTLVWSLVICLRFTIKGAVTPASYNQSPVS